ncbi:MAG: site-specific integrase [Clostridia bacterium]|nr:site-specific integrase [Clostridia bacterium]MDQ7791407.1 site-specific integrase [Clostridia bacterium]
MASRDVGIKQISDNKWYIRYDVQDPLTGKRIQKHETFAGTKRQAQLRRNELVLMAANGELAVTRLTVRDLMDQWQNHYCRGNRPEKRKVDIKSRINVHINPGLGEVPLSKLDTWKVQAFIDSINRAPRTIQGIYETLNMALKWGLKMKLIRYNPAEDVELPTLGKRQIDFWNSEEVKRFLAVTKDSKHWMLFELALATGMRQGELLALRWQDIDFEKGKLFVRHTLHLTSKGWELAPPKTITSRRILPLSLQLRASLKRHKVQQDKDQLRIGPSWQNSGLVFTNELGNPLDHNNLYKRHFLPLVEKSKVKKIRFHGLRHTYATICLERGMHIKVLSARLGQTNEGFTLTVYAGMAPVLEAGTAEILDDLFVPNGQTKG